MAVVVVLQSLEADRRQMGRKRGSDNGAALVLT
jgi:hypothetical protein